MITLTLAPAGMTWRYNDEERRWELGRYDYIDRWRPHFFVNLEVALYTNPEIFSIFLKEVCRLRLPTHTQLIVPPLANDQ